MTHRPPSGTLSQGAAAQGGASSRGRPVRDLRARDPSPHRPATRKTLAAGKGPGRAAGGDAPGRAVGSAAASSAAWLSRPGCGLGGPVSSLSPRAARGGTVGPRGAGGRTEMLRRSQACRGHPEPRTPPPARPAAENGLYLHQPPAGRHLGSGAAAFPECIAAGRAAVAPALPGVGAGRGRGTQDVHRAYCLFATDGPDSHGF